MSWEEDERDGYHAGLIAVGILAIILFVGGLGLWFHACSTAERATLGAVDLEVDRRNSERSQAYREGLRRDCDELMLAHARARSAEERSVVLSTLRHRVAGAPPEAVPADVRAFLAVHEND